MKRRCHPSNFEVEMKSKDTCLSLPLKFTNKTKITTNIKNANKLVKKNKIPIKMTTTKIGHCWQICLKPF